MGVVIVAAGQGTRAGDGERKQLRPIAGVPMLLRAIRPFASHPDVGTIVVALPDDLVRTPPPFLADLVGERLRLVAGGPSREASVACGLDALAETPSVIVVHDGARPFVSRTTIDAVVAVARAGQGAVAAVPVVDTLRRWHSGADASVVVPREDLWRAQTPQAFPGEALRSAFTLGTGRLHEFTDDAAVFEAAGFAVVMVEDDTANLKVTTPADFRLAEALATR